MSEIIKNRSEILFIYDVTDANPNGDVDENKPRIDEATGYNIVTDVRLKRTIRDYLYKFREKEIFIREIEYEPGKIQDAKLRAEDFLLDEKGNKISKSELEKNLKKEKPKISGEELLQVMKKIIEDNAKNLCIDIRLFGVTMPVEWDEKNRDSITYTGPVQFKFGRSLHKVGEPTLIRGTGAFASEPGAKQKTIREEYILPYSLIAFYGIINENAAKETGLTEEDVELLLDGIWNGTKNLITRSKVGQMPRLILQVIYKEKNYHIGELDHRIKLIKNNPNQRDEEIRRIEEVKLDVTELADVLEKNKEKIEKIRYKKDKYLEIIKKGETIEINKIVEGIKFEELTF
jgi:CRISPR-associated protein Csh2